jgi:hypothetical protein
MRALKRWRPWRDSRSQASDLLTSDRRAERSANRFKILEYLSAALVLAGVVGEYVPPFIALLPKVRFWLALKSVWPGAAIGSA